MNRIKPKLIENIFDIDGRLLRKEVRMRRLLIPLMLMFGLVIPTLTMAPASAVEYHLSREYVGATPFYLSTNDGFVGALGGAVHYGDLRSLRLNKPIIGVTPTYNEKGYWLVASDGGVFGFGNAGFYGSTGSIRLNKPIVGMAPTSTGKGYWMVASDGGIFAFGDAGFYGSTGSIRLNKPIVAMAAAPDDEGYWLVASDGGIFAFGSAGFYGSTGSIRLNQPIVAMAPSTQGYWLMASDGGIFAFGNAGFYGSAAGTPDRNYKTMIPSKDKAGYWLIRNGGDAYAFGSAASADQPTTTNRRKAVGMLFEPTTAGERTVEFSMRQLDKPYLWGGNGPDRYDCSGMIAAAWRNQGVQTPRGGRDQFRSGRPIGLSDLRPGDILAWGPDPDVFSTVDHVAIYVGGGWAIESGGQSNPSRVFWRSVPHTAGWMVSAGSRIRG